ncbi:MAG: HAD-IA family hydrolase [Clostridia bacterium]|nr:HAD-IA family hydrolase [Clostridia bacterium]
MIKAVVFDLDDTLYPEIDYVHSGFVAVANEVGKKFGIANSDTKLMRLFAENTSNVFDRFAIMHGLDNKEVKNLIELYRDHVPDIVLSDEVKTTLTNLRQKGYKLGIITDGRPRGQHHKIAALGLGNMVDNIIVTDELGIQFRKPHAKAFSLMCDRFNIVPTQMIYVGDNPQKDFAVKSCLPIMTIHLQSERLYGQKEYLNGILPDFTVHSIREVERIIEKY